ncbi:hypothetical protein ACOME3_004642 [Neoechinorhynchus agilis]
MISNIELKCVASLLGLLLSVYAYYLKLKLKKQPDYVALCDIKTGIGCTGVLKSRYGQGFGIAEKLFGKESPLNIPNSILGIIFYSFQFFTCYAQAPVLLSVAYYSSILSIVFTVYLAYILFFVLKEICLICIPTYVLNIVIFLTNYKLLANKYD